MKCAVAHIALLAMIASAAFAQHEKPIAMSWHGGSLFVLSKSGTVSVYDPGHRRLLRTFQIAANMRPITLVSERISNVEAVYVSGFYGRQNVVLRYSSDGRLLDRFNTAELAAGLDIDSTARVLYAANPTSRTVVALPLDGKSHVSRLVAYVGPARTLGPILFDEQRRRLLVADGQSGILYAIDYRSGDYTPITSDLGSPVALAFDSSFSLVYVADYIEGKISILHVSSKQRPKSVQTALSTLSALAAAPGSGNLFIGDEDKGVFLFSTKTRHITSSW